MEQVANQVIFFLLSAVVVVCSIMAVTSRRILRAATYLRFLLRPAIIFNSTIIFWEPCR